ncbi:MAG TPA: cbb3-type cytochrome c oxidase subunit II [Gammaproteobacteria bacterium]|nr:cbb3-type cytochrome c oxidase subunit II [Gammaproteobacteria bacterium]
MKALWLIIGGSTLIYAILALMMGVSPGIDLSHTPPGPNVNPLTPLEAEGRAVYVANGCGYCHTQQVRPLPEDSVFGRPSAPGDFAYQTPELLGSERTGPDLTNVGARQSSEVWQYMHLYEPRAVMPQSIMPSFNFLFRVVPEAPAGVAPVPVPKPYAPPQGVVIPTQKAMALVAYLLSLKQPLLPGAAAQPATTAITPSAAHVVSAKSTPGPGFDSAKGAQLFSANCAACHQATGEGIPGVFPPLKDNAVVNDPNPSQQIQVILSGLHGTTIGGIAYPGQMPAFASILSDADIVNIIDHERSSWGNHAPLATAAQVAAERAKLKHWLEVIWNST